MSPDGLKVVKVVGRYQSKHHTVLQKQHKSPVQKGEEE